MTHLMELCSDSCLFDASNPLERKLACDLCYISEVVMIVPALQALIFGKPGEVIANYKDKYFVREIMSNGEPTISTVSKTKVKICK